MALICGCGHSGTSLLANMFAAHPDVYVPTYETRAFLFPEEEARERLKRLRRMARAAGCKHLVEKTPRHIRELDLIRKIVHRPRIIIAVRDGRDVVASMAKRYRRPDSVHLATERWIMDNRKAAREAERDDVQIYRHEDLIKDPAGVLEMLCRFAGIRFDEAMLNYHQQERSWFGQKSDPGPDAGPDATDDWRTERTQEHIELRNRQINQPIYDSTGKGERELVATAVEFKGRNGGNPEQVEANNTCIVFKDDDDDAPSELWVEQKPRAVAAALEKRPLARLTSAGKPIWVARSSVRALRTQPKAQLTDDRLWVEESPREVAAAMEKGRVAQLTSGGAPVWLARSGIRVLRARDEAVRPLTHGHGRDLMERFGYL